MFVSRSCISCDLKVFRVVYQSNLSPILLWRKIFLLDVQAFCLKIGTFSKVTGLIPALLDSSVKILHYLNSGYKSLLEVAMKIYAKYSSEGTRLRWLRWNELRNRRLNKENMNKFWTFIAVQKSEKYIIYNKIRQANLVQVLVERRTSKEK